jgi:hypothetical protein
MPRAIYDRSGHGSTEMLGAERISNATKLKEVLKKEKKSNFVQA